MLGEFMNKIESIPLGGVKQYFGAYSKSLDNPLVLYLHGGPADSCIPLIEKYNLPLADNMTLVVLEQRGAGLSYYKFSQDENLCIQTFIDDIHEFVLFYLINLTNKNYILSVILGVLFWELNLYKHILILLKHM